MFEEDVETGEVVVLASDGVWDRVEDQKVMQIVKAIFDEHRSKQSADVHQIVKEMSVAIVRSAYDLASNDNLTCIVVALPSFNTLL